MTEKDREDIIASLAIRLEREFIFRDFDKGEDNSKNYITSDCFVTPPAKGEYYATSKAVYEVLTVTHVYNSSAAPGVIFVKKVRDI
jgi:hypothetical protein